MVLSAMVGAVGVLLVRALFAVDDQVHIAGGFYVPLRAMAAAMAGAILAALLEMAHRRHALLGLLAGAVVGWLAWGHGCWW